MALLEAADASDGHPVKVSDDPEGLTFVSHHLAIGYTMWLSPQARLAVLRGFKEERERSIADGAGLPSTAKLLGQVMEQAKEDSERAGLPKPH